MDMKILMPFVISFMVLIYMPLAEAQIIDPDPVIEDSDTVKGIDAKTDDIKEIVSKIQENTKIEVSVGATEYTVGDEAIIHVKVSEAGIPIDDAFCDALVFYPNLTQFDSFQLSKVQGSRGVYAKNLTVPDTEGVYIVDVNCLRPFGEISQRFYLMSFDFNDDDLRFNNQTGIGAVIVGMNLVGVGNSQLTCYPDRFSTLGSDFEDGKFQPLGFVKNISQGRIWANRNSSVSPFDPTSEQYEIFLRFYKETEFGEIHLDATKNSTFLNVTGMFLSFAESEINSYFKEGESLEMEICAISMNSTGNPDQLNFLWNTTLFNSSFLVNSIDFNATLDFSVGGSSEMNVRNIPLDTAIMTSTFEKISNHNLCVSNTTLQHNITLKVGNQPEQSIIQTEECPFGCDTENNRCNSSPFETLLIYGVALAVGLTVVVIIVKKVAR